MVTKQLIDAALLHKFVEKASEAALSGWLEGAGIRAAARLAEAMKTHGPISEIQDYPGLGPASEEKIRAADRDELEYAILEIEEAEAEQAAKAEQARLAEEEKACELILGDLEQILNALDACPSEDYSAMADDVPNVVGRMTHDPDLMERVEKSIDFWGRVEDGREAALEDLAAVAREESIRVQKAREAEAAAAREAEVAARVKEYRDMADSYEVRLREDPKLSSVLPTVRKLTPLPVQQVVNAMIEDGVINESDFRHMLSRLSKCRKSDRWTRGFDAVLSDVYGFDQDAVLTARKRFAERDTPTPLYSSIQIDLSALQLTKPKKVQKKAKKAKKVSPPVRRDREGGWLRAFADRNPYFRCLL